MKSLKSFESRLRRDHQAVTAAEIEAGLAPEPRKKQKPRPPGIPYDRRPAVKPAVIDDGKSGMEVTLSFRVGSKALPVDLYDQFVAKAKAVGRDPEEILSELVREGLASGKPAPVPALHRPPAPGWWWWRADAEDAWAALEVRNDAGELYVVQSEPEFYQCDGDPAFEWIGEWHPVAMVPPAKGNGGVR